MSNQIVRELTPELADKIILALEKEVYEDKITKEKVLHELKQIRASIGKIRKKYSSDGMSSVMVIDEIIEVIDRKINKVKLK